MGNCQFCQSPLTKDARFCSHCGAKVKQAKTACGHCQHENPTGAQFCAGCGTSIGEIPVESSYIDTNYKAKYPLDFRDIQSLGGKIRQYFVMALDTRILEAHDPNNKEAYLNHLMRSDFQEIFKLRTDQLAEEAYSIHSKQGSSINKDVDQMLETSFEGLLDFFLIKYCQEINEVTISDATLKYEGIQSDQVNLYQMLLDYLAFDQEELMVYTDFLKMPLPKLQNAGRYYLFPAKQEKIILVCDQTVFGSCKEGFAMTEAALYWKAHFKKAEKVAYKDLKTVEKAPDHILINGHFFNATPSLNVKMIYLLNRLKRMK